MNKKIEVFEGTDLDETYFIQNAKSEQEAWDYAIINYPEIMESYELKDIRQGTMRKCKDCKSYWMGDDVCGDCGELRLSKIEVPVYWLSYF